MKFLGWIWNALTAWIVVALPAKALGLLDWSWLVVLSPLWIFTLLMVLGMNILVNIVAQDSLKKKNKKVADQPDNDDPFKPTKIEDLKENQIFAWNKQVYVLLSKKDSVWKIAQADTGEAFEINPEYMNEMVDVFR